MNKVILHVDMDAFFASVEQLDNSRLRGKPVIVGGIGERGVVSTCSYEARKFGVHSAMPVFIAKGLCPQGVFLPTRMYRYKEISNRIFDIFKEVTPLIEPLSIDEAFLDLTDSSFKSGEEAAFYIKKKVKNDIGLNLSIGISYNKFLAKLASDWNKPNGLKVITKEMIPNILFPLPISKIYGLGKKSVKRLNNMGLFTVKDLYDLPIEFFINYMGKQGVEIYERIRGIDKREVSAYRERKSVGKETTLKTNTDDKEELKTYLNVFAKNISFILNNKNIQGKTVTLKYKTESFENHTRSKTLSNYIWKEDEILSVAYDLLENETFSEKIRLIGISISSFKENEIEQLKFI